MMEPQVNTFSVFLKNSADWFAYLRRKWLVLVLAGLLGGILGITYAWLTPVKYEARLTFSLVEENSPGGGILGLASQFGFDIGKVGGIFSGESILQLFRSRRIIENALLSTVNTPQGDQRLIQYYLNLSKKKSDEARSRVSFPVNQQRVSFSPLQDSVLSEICEDLSKQMLTQRPDRKYNIFEIVYRSTDPFFAKQFTNQLVNEVTNFYIETKTKRGRDNVALLESRADSIRRVYEGAMYGRASISDAMVNPTFQTSMVGVQRKQSDITIMGMAYGEIVKNLEIAKYSLMKETPLIQIIDEPTFPLKKTGRSRMMWGIMLGGLFGFIALAYLVVKRRMTTITIVSSAA